MDCLTSNSSTSGSIALLVPPLHPSIAAIDYPPGPLAGLIVATTPFVFNQSLVSKTLYFPKI